MKSSYEVIGEFQYCCGEWWESDYYWKEHGCLFRWQWVGGEYIPPAV